jgi:hypothetical protein
MWPQQTFRSAQLVLFVSRAQGGNTSRLAVSVLSFQFSQSGQLVSSYIFHLQALNYLSTSPSNRHIACQPQLLRSQDSQYAHRYETSNGRSHENKQTIFWTDESTATLAMLFAKWVVLANIAQKLHFKQEVLRRNNLLLSFHTTGTAWKTPRPTIILLLRVFVTAGTCLPSRYLATAEGYTYRYTDWWVAWSTPLRWAQVQAFKIW